MSMRSWIIVAASLAAAASAALAAGKGPGLGQPMTPEELAAWDISVSPSGRELPTGSGTVAQGEAIYERQCVACHGAKGAGKPNDTLVGGQGKLAGREPALKTVGSYWPHATTVFDYVRRAMPLNAPQSLSNDEAYAVTAYLLNLNGIIAAGDTMNANTLAAVRMPNRDNFKSMFKPAKSTKSTRGGRP